VAKAHNVITNQQAIISLKEAKKKLSPEVKANLTDDQIVFIVTKLESIAREFITSWIPKSHTN
jgi:hypothetical protein